MFSFDLQFLWMNGRTFPYVIVSFIQYENWNKCALELILNVFIIIELKKGQAFIRFLQRHQTMVTHSLFIHKSVQIHISYWIKFSLRDRRVDHNQCHVIQSLLTMFFFSSLFCIQIDENLLSMRLMCSLNFVLQCLFWWFFIFCCRWLLDGQYFYSKHSISSQRKKKRIFCEKFQIINKTAL